MFLATDNSYTANGTIGGSVGGALFLVTVCVIIVVVCRRRAYARSIRTFGAGTSVTTVVSMSVSRQVGGKILKHPF